MTQATTAVLKVNEKNLVRNLKYAFSNKDTVLGELMQNARRAKATKIEFTMEGNVLTIVDDGIGIADMQNLLSVAESGWDAETLEVEKAFGMGWLSCLFAADHVTVESRGKLMKFDTEKAIGFGHLDILDAPNKTLAGTRLVLSGFEMNEHQVQVHLRKKARGFPIDVYFNGVAFERDLAQDKWNMDFTSVGHIAIRGLQFGQDGEIRTKPDIIMFLQGLPIFESSHWVSTSNPDIIVHLDSKRFAGRMPDRDRLVDEAEVLKEVQSVVLSMVRQHLEAQLTCMSEPQWLDRYWDVLDYADAKSMAYKLPFIPARLFNLIDDSSPEIENWRSNSGLESFKAETFFGNEHVPASVYVDGCFTREAIESGTLKVVNLPATAMETCFSVAYQLADANHCLVIDEGDVSDAHWLAQHIVILDEEAYGEEGGVSYVVTAIDESARGRYVGSWDVGGDVVVARQFHIRFVDGEKTIMEGVAPTSFVINKRGNDGWMETQYCVSQIDRCSHLPHQVTDFMSDDTYQEGDADDEKSSFARYVRSLTVATPAETLMHLVGDSIKWEIRSIAQLHGKKFSFVIDEHGDVSITEDGSNK